MRSPGHGRYTERGRSLNFLQGAPGPRVPHRPPASRREPPLIALALTSNRRHFRCCEAGLGSNADDNSGTTCFRAPRYREGTLALTQSHVVGPVVPAVREMTFGDLLREAADTAPDRLALIAGVPDPALRRQWTYAQLYREARRTARALLTRFKPGDWSPGNSPGPHDVASALAGDHRGRRFESSSLARLPARHRSTAAEPSRSSSSTTLNRSPVR